MKQNLTGLLEEPLTDFGVLEGAFVHFSENCLFDRAPPVGQSEEPSYHMLLGGKMKCDLFHTQSRNIK